MNYKFCCVIDSSGLYKEFVVVFIENDVETVQHYEMQEGESLIDCNCAPLFKVHADSNGFIKPKWNGTEWEEGATETEVAEWNKLHPAPDPEPEPEPEPDMWDEMAAAIAEGVNSVE